MKKTVLLLMVAMVATMGFAQKEDLAVTERLKQKYYQAVYLNSNGGWYSIKKGYPDCKACTGACDLQGKEVIPPIFDKVHYGGDYYEVQLNGKVAIHDLNNRELLPFKYEDVRWFLMKNNGYCDVKLNGKIGVVDKQGKEIIPCEYTYVNISKIENATAKWTFVILTQGGTVTEEDYPPLNAKWGLYDLDNKKWIASCKYDYITYPSEGLAAFNVGGKITDVKIEDSVSGGKWGYFDLSTGKEIIPAQYETAGAFSEGAAQVSLNGQTTLIENPLAKGKANIGGQLGALTSDVDVNIPVTNAKNDETFAFIIANENYLNFSVPFANNDGKIFKEYCSKTLGLPEQNIRFYENATFGNMASAINKIKDYADAYDGSARFIVYYSGQGLTDDKTKTPYLLPVDASLTNLPATGYSVEKLNRELSEISAKSTLLIVDACFSGTDRDGKMLAASRGVAIKANPNRVDGSLIVFSATTGDETAYQYKDKGHGLFTYFLLKKLQETKGDISCKALTDYVSAEVKRQSVSGDKVQSPTITASDKLTNWQTLKFK